MNREQIIRAWKDEESRSNLSEAERASLPEHPAGLIELPDSAINSVAGGTIGDITDHYSCWPDCEKTIAGSCRWWTAGCCYTELQ